MPTEELIPKKNAANIDENGDGFIPVLLISCGCYRNESKH
jgi:hypothetical protein